MDKTTKKATKKAVAHPDQRDKADGKAPCSRTSPRCLNRIAPWRAASYHHQSERASLIAEGLVWDARCAKDGKVVCFFRCVIFSKPRDT